MNGHKLIIIHIIQRKFGDGWMSVNRRVGNLMIAEDDVWEPCNALQNKVRK